MFEDDFDPYSEQQNINSFRESLREILSQPQEPLKPQHTMSIIAKSNGTPRELIPQGNHVARCYKMIHIGTVDEEYQGQLKKMNKVRIGWELPLELRLFGERGELPLVIDKEYTLSMHERSALRKDLESWRGKVFTAEEAESFDITRLLGAPCMLNIVHVPSKKDPSRYYEKIQNVTAVPKGMQVPPQVNQNFELSYTDWDDMKFDVLPDFIRTKMMSSEEYRKMTSPQHPELEEPVANEVESNDLPF